MITRYEAFLDSLRASHTVQREPHEIIRPKGMVAAPFRDRVLYFPYMCDGAYAVAAASRSCGIHAEVLPMQDEEDLELGRKYTSARECFPMICTTGSFLKKLMEPGVEPSRISFFMPDHNGPCRFGQYNRLQRVIFDRLGFRDVKIISPSNDTSYEDISGGRGAKFRYNAWRGLVAVDLLRKLKQGRTPYEIAPGSTETVYQRALRAVVSCVERGADDLTTVLHDAAREFDTIALAGGLRKPVISVVGEIFMRDNAFCSGFLVKRLEAFGAETVIAPFAEWLSYSTYRYTRDSRWKGDYRGVLKSKLQEFTQDLTANQLRRAVHGMYDEEREVELHQMLDSCAPYIHRHYDGDPALNLGSSVALAGTGISGIANILPFTCMPGTIVACVSDQFKRDHDNIPYVSIAYDGQQDSSIDLRLQAFMHQAQEFGAQKGYDRRIHASGRGAQWSKESIHTA
jgi:predicted nucleotide-binding protein (sugar kinase/HSP70/actin superfamily)